MKASGRAWILVAALGLGGLLGSGASRAEAQVWRGGYGGYARPYYGGFARPYYGGVYRPYLGTTSYFGPYGGRVVYGPYGGRGVYGPYGRGYYRGPYGRVWYR